MRLAGSEPALPAVEAELLREMLHALGQPLTVLGGLRLMGRGSGAEELLEEMADGAERATAIYRAMRLLVEGERGGVEVRGVEAEWRRRSLRRGVELRFAGGDGWGESRMLEGVLGAGLRSCEAGGVMRVEVAGGWLEVAGGRECGVEGMWEMRVAERVARVGLEGGDAVERVVYKLQPFHARVRLQLV